MNGHTGGGKGKRIAPAVSPRQTAEERRDKMLVRREFTSEQAQYLVLALHDAGIRSVLIESMQIGEEDYHARVSIDRDELGWDQLDTIRGVALGRGAKVALGEVRMNQQVH